MIRLLNSNGGLILTNKTSINPGNNSVDFNLVDKPRGVYYIQVIDALGKSLVTKKVDEGVKFIDGSIITGFAIT